jgi:hypothetical protein
VPDGGVRDASGRRPRRLAVEIAFWIAVAVLVVANLVVLGLGVTMVRLWEDEAFNLTVPINLVAGLGYTSDGTLSGSELTPFDVRISTGPTLLLPIAGLVALGVDPVFAGRALAAMAYLALLAALALIGRRLGGRWAALVAVAIPLAFETSAVPSPIQTPVDILGEVTAAALLAAALVFVHRRPWLAGLLLGFAIQAKFIALLAAPAFAVAVLLDTRGPWSARLREGVPKVLVAAGAAALPTVAFEISKLASLGPADYWQHLREFAWFVRSGGQQGVTSPLDKLATLLGSWNLPVPVAVLAALVVVAGSALVVIAIRRMPREHDLPADTASRGERASREEFTAIVLAAALAFATFLAWWLAARHTPAWVRHPAPAVLAFLPVLVASLVPAARLVLGGGPTPGGRASTTTARVWRSVAVAASVLTVVALTWSISGRVAVVSERVLLADERLPDQRAIGDAIAELGLERAATTWGAGVSIGVLAGLHVGLLDAGDASADDPRLLHSGPPPGCEVILQAGAYVVCPPE